MGRNRAEIRSISETIINTLAGKGFVVQEYKAYGTDSIYLKLDYGVCNTIRISDHKSKDYLCYRYNVIIDGSVDIIEEKFIRYFFNQDTINNLLNTVLFDRMAKLNKYGLNAYKNFMLKNRLEHKKDNKGFWRDAKLVTKDIEELSW